MKRKMVLYPEQRIAGRRIAALLSRRPAPRPPVATVARDLALIHARGDIRALATNGDLSDCAPGCVCGTDALCEEIERELAERKEE